MTAPSSTSPAGHALVIEFPFTFDLPFRLAALPFGVTPGRARVVIDDDTFRAEFGPWTVETPLANIAGAEVTGPYLVPKVIGPPHLSLRDRGLTFATTARQGVCIEFREPVPGSLPNRLLLHPSLTVTVAEPAELAELLDVAARHHPVSPDDEVSVDELVDEVHDDLEALTASELRERARARGLAGISSMRKRELIDALSVPEPDEP
jgi:hypothetical protein